MTRDEHRDAALRLLGRCGDIKERSTQAEYSRQMVILAAAQVHATLAGPDRADLVMADGWCACSRKPFQHPVGPRCGTTPMPPPPDEPQAHSLLCFAPHGPDTPCPVPADQDPHVDGCPCPGCEPVPSDGPGQ